MAKKHEMRDVFLNFFSLSVTAGGASNVLATQAHTTAAGVATQVGWRIHTVEWFPVRSMTASLLVTLALSTRKGLAAMPALGDKGLVAKHETKFVLATSGAGFAPDGPAMQSFLPPIIIATPNLSLYCITDTDHAPQQSVVHRCRIGFTMVELDSAVYTELWQTWNFAD